MGRDRGRSLLSERGGPQRIPRPHDARAGRLAPWADLVERTGPPTIDSIEANLAGRVPGSMVTGAPGARRPSAVLIALYDEPESGTHVVLTRRSPAMRTHRWEVAFPGGRQDPGETLEQTALREAAEEVDLDGDDARFLGQLDRLATVSSNAGIVPFVAALPTRPVLTPNPAEVERILHVPLSELLLPGVYREERWAWPDDGTERPIHFFELVGDTVWGATANLLRQLVMIGVGLDPREP